MKIFYFLIFIFIYSQSHAHECVLKGTSAKEITIYLCFFLPFLALTMPKNWLSAFREHLVELIFKEILLNLTKNHTKYITKKFPG